MVRPPLSSGLVCLSLALALLPACAQGQVEDPRYTPEQIRSISAESFVDKLAPWEPGYQFSALNALIDKAKGADGEERSHVITVIAAAMLDKTRPHHQRWQCCNALGEIGDEQAVPALIGALGDDSLTSFAIESLQRFPNNAVAKAALLHPPVPRVVETLPPLAKAVEERAPSGPPQPPPGPSPPVAKPLPWPFPGSQEEQCIFNNYQQATDAYIHCGLDFIHEAGTPVLAVDSGYVATISTNYPDWITHHFFIVTPKEGGNEGWCYTHLDPRTFTFVEGDYVRQGQRLGSLVDFSVGNQPGVAHLHLHYVRFTRGASGRVQVHSLLDPLYFFDWKDTEAPVFQPLWFISEDTGQRFQPDAAGVVKVSGKVGILAAVTDGAYPGHMGNLGLPVVTLSISNGTQTMQKVVVDHRGDVGEETRVRPLYLSYQERKAFLSPDAFPRYQLMRVTRTDGDGRITTRDATECWDTTARDSKGRRAWPSGEYSVNVYAWDIAGNRAVVGAVVRVRN
jgi:hypothetical protein